MRQVRSRIRLQSCITCRYTQVHPRRGSRKDSRRSGRWFERADRQNAKGLMKGPKAGRRRNKMKTKRWIERKHAEGSCTYLFVRQAAAYTYLFIAFWLRMHPIYININFSYLHIWLTLLIYVYHITLY